MIIFKIKKPKTPSQRQTVKIINTILAKKPQIKTKILGFKNKAGRANTGKISVRHRGGGHKRKYRKINFNYKNTILKGIVYNLEYDPNRTANIASVYNINTKKFFYMLAPQSLKIGDSIKSGGNFLKPRIGYFLPLKKIPIGSYIYCISLQPLKSASATRSAGTYATIVEKSNASAKIKLSSGKIKTLSLNCYATIGLVSNDAHFLTKHGKAGNSRWLRIRPTVRGVAMNPVDHPHGGGEGKKSGNKKTPWGKQKKNG